jgi:hypothetical protein
MTSAAAARFRASMLVDRDRWRDGIGYDLEALDAMTAAERAGIEAELAARATPDWRDLEALARLGGSAARLAMQRALRHGDPGVRGAALRHGWSLLSDGERLLGIRRALEEATLFNGLTEALEAAEAFHPPAVIDLLLRALLAREGEVAVHLAALLVFLHGLADEPFDWAQRPFFLRFATADPAERRAAFRELCVRLDRDPAALLSEGS